MNITASTLYDYIKCPHKVWRDIYGPQGEKIAEANPFVQLLWDKGVLHEKEVVKTLGSIVDLSEGTINERIKKTRDAINGKEELIYQGVISHGNLLGIPDLLKRFPDGKYIAIDIKSGCGFEGADEESGEEGKPKKHYAMQLCLYTEILMRLGLAEDKKAWIIDIHGAKVEYDLEPWWTDYEAMKSQVQMLVENTLQNKPAYSPSACKLCPWYISCKRWCIETKDMTNVFKVGRAQRDQLLSDLSVATVDQLVDLDVQELMERKKKDKTFLKGVAEKTLSSMVQRAKVVARLKKPVIYGEIVFPSVERELFFDIEDDPTQDFVYLHGVYERSGKKGRYIPFVAKDNTTPSERTAWLEFWEYIRSLSQNSFAVYYYSHHEHTTYKRMQKKYPDVISKDELDAFFGRDTVIDLYKIVVGKTDWPLGSYSIKEIATYLGFKWRDKTPSGALSIQWYNDFLASGDKKVLQRILDYNEDDCLATLVLKDGLIALSKS